MTTIVNFSKYGKLIVSDLSLNHDLSANPNAKGNYGPTGSKGEKGEIGQIGIVGNTGPIGPVGNTTGGGADPWTEDTTNSQIYFNYDTSTSSSGTKRIGTGPDPATG